MGVKPDPGNAKNTLAPARTLATALAGSAPRPPAYAAEAQPPQNHCCHLQKQRSSSLTGNAASASQRRSTTAGPSDGRQPLYCAQIVS
eukprot:CAMPEP_0115185138 /NCGR_PEP_ID=MMETSP0270-20121206/9317_1 /TAXON_ID=71861 /ORGANISM="Scrippsiella trochoidea, Strain CCMP3099" /LENGTH=87 /DNA_ID=CAMNT_0002598233 /DNA_START=350 /DNA_END=614 /DNA_ORIENTATION=-